MTEEYEPPKLLALADECYRRVLMATWNGEPYNYYCVKLECGHHTHPGGSFLSGQLLCMECLRDKFANRRPE